MRIGFWALVLSFTVVWSTGCEILNPQPRGYTTYNSSSYYNSPSDYNNSPVAKSCWTWDNIHAFEAAEDKEIDRQGEVVINRLLLSKDILDEQIMFQFFGSPNSRSDGLFGQKTGKPWRGRVYYYYSDSGVLINSVWFHYVDPFRVSGEGWSGGWYAYNQIEIEWTKNNG